MERLVEHPLVKKIWHSKKEEGIKEEHLEHFQDTSMCTKDYMGKTINKRCGAERSRVSNRKHFLKKHCY